MSFKGALASHLKNHAGVSALVGVHVYRGSIPSNAPLPRLVISQIGSEHVRHMGGSSGLVERQMLIEAQDDDEPGADDLADTVRDALDGFRGTLGSTPNTATVRASFLTSESDGFIRPGDSGPVTTYIVDQRWTFWHTETVPSL